MLHLAKYVFIIMLVLIPFSPAAIAATDSSNIQSGQTISPKMPTTETSVNAVSRTAQSIGTTEFSNLSGCPGDPTRIAQYGGWPATPQCPNDNGVWPNGLDPNGQVYDPVKGQHIAASEANCPATCTVTRYVERDINDNPVALTEASCPVGYLAVGTYDMEPEYVTTTAEESLPSPLSWADYTRYVNQHYYCTVDSTASGQEINTCADANSATYSTYAGRVTVGAWGEDDTQGSPMQDSSGHAGVWKPITWIYLQGPTHAGYCYYDDSNCDQSIDRVTGEPHPGQTGCTPTYMYNVKVRYDFYYISCLRPAGSVVQTSYTAPASVVCARVSSEWRSPN